MTLNRNIEAKIEKMLEVFPAVVLIGARQAGKTTLAQKVRAKWDYFDLENPNTFDLIQRDPVLFFTQFPSHIILDEAQCFPELFNVLRGVIDNRRQEKGRFIITGSSSPELLTNISESLAGRVGILEVDTLKCNEFYQKPLSSFYEMFANKLDKTQLAYLTAQFEPYQVRNFWLKGGYPEPLLSNNQQAFEFWMENYIATYINRDVASLFPRLDKVKFNRFIQALSKLSSTIINKSELGRMLEFNESTARDYLSIADKTFIWREMLSFEKSITKSIVKMPKGHLRDSGLLHYMLGIRSQDELFKSPSIGYSFESFVIEEIIKGMNSSFITNWAANYFRTRSGSEVDLILDGPFGVLPIEIKYSSSNSPKQLRPLEQFIRDNQLEFGLVINQAERAMWLTETIYQLPVTYL